MRGTLCTLLCDCYQYIDWMYKLKMERGAEPINYMCALWTKVCSCDFSNLHCCIHLFEHSILGGSARSGGLVLAIYVTGDWLYHPYILDIVSIHPGKLSSLIGSHS